MSNSKITAEIQVEREAKKGKLSNLRQLHFRRGICKNVVGRFRKPFYKPEEYKTMNVTRRIFLVLQ